MYRIDIGDGDVRLRRTPYIYEASWYHQMLLKHKYKEKGVIWTPSINGTLLEIGTKAGQPLKILANWVRVEEPQIDPYDVMLYEPTSCYVDRWMLYDWLKKNMPQASLWNLEIDIRNFDRPITQFNMHGIGGFVQADTNAQAILRERFKGWQEIENGVIKLGDFQGKPTLLDLTKVRIGRKTFAFWWICSLVFDFELVEKWIVSNKLRPKMGLGLKSEKGTVELLLPSSEWKKIAR